MKLKPSVLAGWVLFLTFLFLTIFHLMAGHILKNAGGIATHILLALVQITAFGLPTLLLSRLRSFQGQIKLRTGRLRMHFLPFVLTSAVAISSGSFLLGMLSALPGGASVQPLQSYYPIGTGALSADLLLSLFTVALLPAVVEELFFRGAMLSLYERRGTLCALLVTSAAFSMMHGSPASLLPSLLAGLGYAYLACVTGSVWSSVIAHSLNNISALGVSILAVNHSFNDYWRYFTALSCVLLFLFAYLALRSLRGLTADGLTQTLAAPVSGGQRTALSGAVRTPGFLLFACCFAFRLIVSILMG